MRPADTRLPLPRRLTLRTRMVVIAAVVMTLVLLLAGAILTLALRAVLLHDAVDASRLRARDIAELTLKQALPRTLPVAGEEEALVQVVGRDGTVFASSPNVARGRRLALPPQTPGTERVFDVDRLPVAGDSGSFRVVARGVATPVGAVTVYVAVSLEDVQGTVAVAAQVGLAGLPVIVLLLCAVLWVVVGRTLAPVEAIRAEADEVTGRELGRRVPEPARLDEIGRLARTVNAMLARLQDSAERQRRFVADAAHELRSPVASLRAQLETARQSRRRVDWQDLSGDLLDETVRMQRLTEQLLLLARTDAGTLETRRVDVDLDDVVDGVTARVATHDGVRVSRAGVEPVRVTGDPVLLRQVVHNLLDNAVRHARHEVAVGLSRVDGQAVLTVDDDGAGIPVERRREVFERFVRLDAARDRDHGGAGLGLALVADIVRVHHGGVEVEDAPLGGARVRVVLPLGGARLRIKT